MKTLQATFSSKDQNWQEGTTTYWFDVLDAEGIFLTLEQDTRIGLVEQAGKVIESVDHEGYPVTNYFDILAIAKFCKITEEMRAK